MAVMAVLFSIWMLGFVWAISMAIVAGKPTPTPK